MNKYYSTTTSDKDILKQEILRRLVYTRAEELMVFNRALPLETMNALEIKMVLPKVTRFDPETISEGALASYQMMEWFETSKTMKKEQVRILVTDESKARMQEDIQVRRSIEAAARGLAWSKDTDICTVLAAGKATTAAAGAAWDTNDADPAGDICTAIEYILTNSYLTDAELRNMKLFYPQGLWGWLNRPLTLGTMPNTMVSTFIKDQYGVELIGTRQLTTSALLVINSPETALHITYSGADIPTSETQRLPGVGNQYILTQYYKTFVMPQEENGTTNTGIYQITGVRS